MPRQSQNQSTAPSRKKALLSVAILLALTGVLVLLFQDHWAEISAALAQLSLGQVALVLALGITYPLLEGVASWLIVRSRLPGFTLRHGIDNAWMGTFGNVICLGAGAVPMQTYYLHRCGLGLGPGVGLMTLQYVFHKAAVLVYATVLLLWNRQWFTAHATGVLSYLPAAYTVVAGVILGLVLLCTAPLVQSPCPQGSGSAAQDGEMAGPPGELADPAGHPERREPPPADRKIPLPENFRGPSLQAFFDVHHPLLLPAVHGAFQRSGFWAGAAAHRADALPLQRSAQCGRHGLH